MHSGPLGRPSFAFWIFVWLIDCGGLAVGVALLWGGFLRERRGRDFWIFAGLFAGMILFSAPLGVRLARSAFALMRITCHVMFCVLAPLLMVRGAWHVHGGRRAVGALMLLLGLGMDFTYYYAHDVERFNLQVRRYDVPSAAWRGDPIKIVEVADLQTDAPGSYEESVFDRIDAERPDLILFAGDYLQVMSEEAYDREQPRLIALFSRLHHPPRLGMFGVYGDVDWSRFSLQGSGVRMLEDESVRVPGVPLQILGLANRPERKAVPDAFRPVVKNFPGLSIVLAHRPDFAADALNREQPGESGHLLMLAGHTHGGQIVLPGLGPLITLSDLPRKYAGGFHRLAGKSGWLVVSRGIGCEREYAPRLRLFCPPELVVLTVHNKP
jgi:predicted MPP superfamily phosphohydrolase